MIGRRIRGTVVHVLPKPGVTDPEAESALTLLMRPRLRRRERPDDPDSYRIDGPKAETTASRLIERVLANDAVEQSVVGPLPVRSSSARGSPYHFRRVEVPIHGKDPTPNCSKSAGKGSCTSASPS